MHWPWSVRGPQGVIGQNLGEPLQRQHVDAIFGAQHRSLGIDDETTLQTVERCDGAQSSAPPLVEVPACLDLDGDPVGAPSKDEVDLRRPATTRPVRDLITESRVVAIGPE